MGIFSWLFSRKKQKIQETEPEGDKPVYDRSQVDFHDATERERYVTGCLEQILSASEEMKIFGREYQLVTSYLKDMEEIEALPEEELEEVRDLARHIETAQERKQDYLKKKNRMSDARYRQLRQQEEEIEEGIRKLTEAEKYHKLIKQDLGKLDGERHAYQYRKAELRTMLVNIQGITGICLATAVVCVLMLLLLQFLLQMDTRAGYFLTIAASAVALTVIYIKYSSAQKELGQVNKAVNRLIQLQNTVKIRYVNNSNLLDYLYLKYNVKSGEDLKTLWEDFQAEKEERIQYEKTEADLEYYQKQLVRTLMRFRINDPGRWVHQTGAILDKREMVEIRHSLILRRQSLRKQLDYNQEIAEEAKQEVKELAEAYPKYAGRITEMVEEYEKKAME